MGDLAGRNPLAYRKMKTVVGASQRRLWTFPPDQPGGPYTSAKRCGGSHRNASAHGVFGGVVNFNSTARRIGVWGAVAILALRLGIGWHFFKEGAKKFTDGVPTVYFLNAAKGPFAELHKGMLPDRYGFDRLNAKKTVEYWSRFRDDVKRQLGFDPGQAKKADQILDRYKKRLNTYLRDNREAIDEYRLEVDRFLTAKQDSTKSVPFQRDRLAQKEAELRGTVAPWLAGVRTLTVQLEKDLNGLDPDSGRNVKTVDRSKPFIDGVVKYWVIGVGILLVLGLCTRLAALGAIGFLLTVMSTQPPWVYGAETTYFYYQLVEVLALFVLYVLAAGQFAGLDYVVHGMYRRCCPPKQENN